MPVSRHLVLATVTGFPDTNVAYPYCLCCYSKLLKDQNQDCWLCCKCGQSCRSDQVEWRYRLALTITDGVTIASVCLFGSMLDQFFGCTATQFKRYLLRLESSCDYSDQLLKRAVEHYFIGHSYYFGFKTTGAFNRQTPNAPITLQQLVNNLETKCQTSHESVSNIVAFQILPSTTTTQSTVLDLIHLDLRKKSSVQTERSPSVEIEAQFITDQTFSSVHGDGATNEPSVSFGDANRSGEGYNDLTHSPTFVSVCGSSFGQETALLSCDMSKSVNNISREALSQHHGTNPCDRTATKGNPSQKDSLGQFSTEQQSTDDIISSEKYAQDFSCIDKSSSYSSPLEIQESSASHELMKVQSQRLDSSGYNSLLKSSLSLEGNSKEFSGIDGSLYQGSWNKENIGDYKFGVESVREDDPFSGSLNNSAILLACNNCTAKSSVKPMFNSASVDKSSAKIVHPLSKGKHVLVSRSSMDNVSGPSNVHTGCYQENFNTGDRIKDRFKQFALVRNDRNRKKTHDKSHILASKESTSDQLSINGKVGAPVGNTSKVCMSDGDKNTKKEGKVPLLTSDTLMENQNPTLAFPESEDMWAYLTDEEEFCNAGNLNMGTPHTSGQSKGCDYVTKNVNISPVYKGTPNTVQSRGGNNVAENVNISQVYEKTPTAVQSRGGNHANENVNISQVNKRTPNTVQSRGDHLVTENANISQVYKNKRTGSDEEDSDETFDECFDPEFLNLVEQDFTDAEDNSDEMSCKRNEKNDNIIQDFYVKITAAEKLNSDDIVDTGSQDSNETHVPDGDVDLRSHNANEENDLEPQDSDEDEVFDKGTHESEEVVDLGTHNSDEDVDTGTHDSDKSHNSDDDVDTGTHDSDKSHNSDEDVDTGTHDSDKSHNSDEDVDTGMHDSDKETRTGGKCNSDDLIDLSGTQDFGEKRYDKGSEIADKPDIDEGTNRETYTDKEIDFTKSRAVLLNSSQVCTSMAAYSVCEEHPTDQNTKLDKPESVTYLQEGVEPMPDSEDLCAFLDSTFGDVTEELSVNIQSHVLNNKEDVVGEKEGDHFVEREKNGEDLDIKDNNDANDETKFICVSKSSDSENLNSEFEIENVRMKTNLKDETMEHLESIFDDSFDEVETGSEDQVLSSQETVFLKCQTRAHNSGSTRDKTAQSSSKSYQHHSERDNSHPLQDTVDSLCGSANTVRFVSGSPDPYNRNIVHSRDGSIPYKHCEALQNQDPYNQDIPIHNRGTEDKQSQDVPTQLQYSQDITGQHLLGKDDQHHFNENFLSQDQSCLSKGLSFSFNTSTDLFGCSGNSSTSVALCNDTYSQSLTHDGVHFFPNSSRVEGFRPAIYSPLRNDNQEIEEKVKTVQFARRLSCVKTIQLIDIEMKMRQNPGRKLPVIPKSCLKLRVASPCSPPCLKHDTKKTKLSKVFSLRKQEKLESQDLFSCSTISENSCDVIINQKSILPGGTEDVFFCDNAVIPGTQDLFTPSPVQMPDRINSDFVLGSASCKRPGKKFKFPTWTKKPSHCQTFISTPLEGYTEKLCASREELSGLLSPNLSQGSEDFFAQNSASLFLDSFDDLHVTNSNSAMVVKYPSSLENHSPRTTNLSKRKDISPICIGFNNQSKGDNHIPTGEVAVDTGTPDLFGSSNVSASTSGIRSNRKVQSSDLATNFTFPVKRLFLD